MSLFAYNATAAIERVLNVSVNVVVDQSSTQLEIVAPRTDFLVVYSPALRRFQPLDIPFRVRQLDGHSHQYDLSLVQLTGQCAASGGVASALIPGVTLDGLSFVLSSPVRGLAAPEQAHMLTLTFPDIAQTPTSQACEGVAGVVAAVVI